MTYLDQGKIGAKRATWRERNPRKLLIKIMADNSNADDKIWREEFWEAVKKDRSDEGDLRACIEYWLDNNINALVPGRGRSRKKQVKDEVDQVRHEIETTIAFLNLTCPNGKRLRDCTGADCRQFGGWYLALAKRVPAKKLVGVVLNEKQVGQIWAENS